VKAGFDSTQATGMVAMADIGCRGDRAQGFDGFEFVLVPIARAIAATAVSD